MTLNEVRIKLNALDKIIEAEKFIVAGAISLCFGSGEDEKKEPESNEDIINHLKEVGIKPPENY